MPRVVADTNVLVRALTGGPGSSSTLGYWQDGRIDLVLCFETLAELTEVLFRPRFQRYFTADAARRLLMLLRQHCVWIESISDSAWTRDAKDDIFVNLAVASGAQFIVSEDFDLIEDAILKDKLLREYGIRIIRDADLITVLGQT